MKSFRLTLYFLLSFFLLGNITTSIAQGSSCNSVDIKTKSKELLKPGFSYDASKTTYVTFLNKKQFKELEVPLYIGEKYKLVFNMEGLPQPLDIEVYDKKYETKGRELLFSSREHEPENNCYSFEPGKSLRKIYIDYLIPPTVGEVSNGCIVMTLGYKIK